MSESDDRYREWIQAGQPEPVAADEIDGEPCRYDDCDNYADYFVLLRAIDGTEATTEMCQECSEKHRMWIRENGILDEPIPDRIRSDDDA